MERVSFAHEIHSQEKELPNRMGKDQEKLSTQCASGVGGVHKRVVEFLKMIALIAMRPNRALEPTAASGLRRLAVPDGARHLVEAVERAMTEGAITTPEPSAA